MNLKNKNKMQWQILKLDKLQNISQNNNKLISDQLQNQQIIRNNQLEKLLSLLLSEKFPAEESFLYKGRCQEGNSISKFSQNVPLNLSFHVEPVPLDYHPYQGSRCHPP